MIMASKKSGGIATKKKPSITKTAARRKVLAPAAKSKPPAKKALTITVNKKPAAPLAPSRPVGSRGIYNVHPGVSMMQKWIAELKQKTGRNLDEWIKFVRMSGPGDV